MSPSETLDRYKSMLALIFRYANSEVVSRIKANDSSLNSEQTDLGEARDLAEDLRKRGPAYIKIGQFLSTQTQLIPDEYAEVLAQLQDQVSPVSLEEIVKVIQEEFPDQQANALLKGIDHQPLACASLAQVHITTLPTGRKVALKIQKPGVEQELRKDLLAFDRLASFLDDYIQPVENFSFVDNLAEFERSLLRELNYKKEAQNLVVLGDIFSEFDSLTVPRTVPRYSTSRVLAMEFIEGKKIESLTANERESIDGYEIADQLFRAYLKQILVRGFMHADPHPGNVLLTPQGKLAVLDAGMVTYFSHETSEQLLKIVLAISDGRGAEAADCVVTLGQASMDFDRTSFRKEIGTIVAEHVHLPLKDISPGGLLLRINRIARESGLVLPTQFSLLGQTLMKLDCVGKLLAPDFDPHKSIRENSSELFAASSQGQVSVQRILSKFMDIAKLTGDIPTHVEQILNNLAHNELQVTIDAIDEKQLLRGFQKIANRITAGLVIAALIIGAALLMRIESSWTLLGYPGFAIILFLIAASMGFYLVIQILWNDE